MDNLINRQVSVYSEFETKYEVSGDKIELFSNILSDHTKHSEIMLYDGRDDYYTNKKGDYIRHRLWADEQELTLKRQIDENTTHRLELNLNVSLTDEMIIPQFLNLLGYDLNFTIFKRSIVFYFNNAAVAFYTVSTKNSSKTRSFIEIEVYNNIANLDEKKAWRIIRKYEKILKDLGLGEKTRINKSLFDMYVQGDSYDVANAG